jgi:DNA-binding transcriptional LysR family regulator
MNDFDMNLIKPFVKVYELNSITKAAELLNVSQPAISGSIKRLENYLDYPLFIRSGRTLSPTPNAQRFYLQVASVLDLVDNALGNKDHFIVYAPENILLKISDIPNIQLIEARNSEEGTFNDLRMRKVDLVIDNVTQKDNSFCFELVRKEHLKLVCRKNHPTIADNISMEQYLKLGHVAMKLVRNNMRAVEYFAKTALKARDIKIQVSSPANMMLAVQNSDYIAAIPEGLCHLADALGLKVLTPPFDMKPIEFHLIYHKRYVKDVNHNALRELIKSKLINF